MEPIKIEGIAQISDNGFRFESGLPSNEPVLAEAMSFHGTLRISRNASAEMQDNGRVYLPPEIHPVACNSNYIVKRTSRHYIIQVKVPVVESRADSESRIQEALPAILGEISLDRKDLLMLDY